MDVVWTAKAKNTFFNVLDFLEINWTIKEIIQFNLRTEIVINAIKKESSYISCFGKTKYG